MDKENLIQIIKSAQRKDTDAFRQLVENYQAYVFSLAFRLVCDEEEAKDIVQDCFVKVWQHINRFDFKAKFTTWLYKIVYNMSLDKIKVNNRRKAIIINAENVSELSEKIFCKHPEEDQINKNLAEIIKVLADELTPKQRAVFVLRDLQGVEMDEISIITSLTKGAIKSNLYYARLNIRTKLEQVENIKILQDEMSGI